MITLDDTPQRALVLHPRPSSMMVAADKVDFVVVNSSISPIQQRNLEKVWNCKVVDRTGLILEIFGLRAATKEGRLQVELARMAYERSRLVRTWTHLERQRGGAGAMSGPGETQIESNAGKSSVFNILTEGGVLAKDMLFATLDTTHRIMPLPSGKPAVLSDTVGFIADLPTGLIKAFRATLEEVKEADLLVHVRDIADPLSEARAKDVMDVLEQIEAGPLHGQAMVEMWNKSDLLSEEEQVQLKERAAASQQFEAQTSAYLASCLSGEGVKELLGGIETALSKGDEVIEVRISPKDYSVRAWLHANGDVRDEDTKKNGDCLMKVGLSEADAGKFRARNSRLIIGYVEPKPEW